eukprot:TRINITY_DN410_c0_g1_i1.p1 TRINITY_DN410_c0_g1~~TRINITY_DN410_c0_g1_i1.p1  ORF type:complete len:265 (-),score=64.64 TRINITY_DN410_c0_g1_i1:738-1532(-)
MWELCQISNVIAYTNSLGLADKTTELKQRCKDEYGLECGSANMKKIESFMQWMREGGAKFRRLQLKYYGPDYRGVHTNGNIKANEVFLKVPYHMIITSKSGRQTEIGKKILATKVKVHWDYLVFITVFLMVEMHNPTSKWKPYLDVYPHLANTFPLFYTDYEKFLLRGTPMLEHIASEYKMLSDEYNRLAEAIPEFREFSEEEYIRNKILVVSRIFYVTLDGVGERIMVPLAGTILLNRKICSTIIMRRLARRTGSILKRTLPS